MGITTNCSKFLAYATSQGVSFSKTLMLGRQVLFFNSRKAEEVLRKFDIAHQPLPEKLEGQFAEPFFTSLGATQVDSVDLSSFENANVLHDLNNPIPESLKGKYTVVFDGGTLEHVFNFPVAIKNCMDMLKVGGHFLAVTPTNNLSGHGFYQFSPELFFSLFDETHGFKTKLVAVGIENPGQGIHDWYAIESPKRVMKRVTLRNFNPTYLMVMAEKIADTEKIILRPLQSDYESIWEVHDSIKNDVPRDKESKVIFYYRKFTPDWIKNVVRKLRSPSADTLQIVEGLGIVNPAYFKKMDI